MFGWFRKLFKGRGPDSLPPDQIFPDIDADRIAADLHLEARGAQRGQNNQPGSDEAGFDLIERKIVDCVERLRRMGLEHFEEHACVYAERIARADQTATDIQIATGDAETDFMAEIKRWDNTLANVRADLRLNGEGFNDFCKENQIKRTAHEGGGFLQWFGLSLVILFVESALNGVFFANAHELGLLGGIFTAFGISVINVGTAALTAWTSRNFNHVRIGRKVVGALVFLGGVSFAATFNLFVAHFRNAAEAGKPWGEAAGHAVQNITVNPIGLESIDAWLLCMLGMLAAALAGWKTYATGDPYPGYGRVWRKIHEAREDYAQSVGEAINTLTETRDKAVSALRTASENAQAQISEAVSASNELVSLRGRLDPFLKMCDQKANLVLATYRNANQGARATPSPKHFSQDFSFEPYKLEQPPVGQNPAGTAPTQQLNEVINEAIDRIYAACKKAIESFETIDDIGFNALAAHALQLSGEIGTEVGGGDAPSDRIAIFPGGGART